MSTLFPVEMMQHTVNTWLPRIKVRTQVIYITVLLSILLTLAALPFIKVDVSATAAGLIRPVSEKNELRSQLGGIIDQVYVTEGTQVRAGQPLVRLQEDISNSKLTQNTYEIGQRETYIHDLSILAAGKGTGLRSSQYQQQYARFQAGLHEQQATVEKLKVDMDMYEQLYKDKVIARKEYLDRKYDYNKSMATYHAAVQQQLSTWQDELSRLRMENNRLYADNRQLEKEKEWNLIKAPVSGTLQQFSGRYAGGYVQAGEVLGVISPDSSLIAECYVSPKDIAYLKVGMPVRFQVEAFNYNEWGLVEGEVQAIDNDFTLMDKQPVFKVKCRFKHTEISTVRGVSGTLKKGMTLQARFLLTRRTLFQLLYDKTDNWMNPNRKQTAAI